MFYTQFIRAIRAKTPGSQWHKLCSVLLRVRRAKLKSIQVQEKPCYELGFCEIQYAFHRILHAAINDPRAVEHETISPIFDANSIIDEMAMQHIARLCDIIIYSKRAVYAT